MFINCYSIKWKLHTLKKKINKMKLIKNLDGVNKILRKQYNHNKCTKNYRLWWKQRCKINLFLGTIHKSLLFICRWKGRHPEKVVYQVDKFTTVKGEAKNLKVKFRHYRFWSTWGCKNELWQILYYNSGRWQQVQYNF